MEPEHNDDYDYDFDNSWETFPNDSFIGGCEYGGQGAYYLPVLYYLFFVLGFVGNVFVLWVKIFGERIRTMTDVCLLNLALADLLLACSLPFLARQAWDQWVYGEAMCKVVLGVYLVGFYCGIFFVIVMSVDMYLAVVHVFSSQETRARSVGRIVAAVIWLAGVLASFPELLFIEVQELPHENRVFCAPKYESENVPIRHFWTVFGLFKMNILGLVIPTAIMGFCYTRAICVLRRSRTATTRSAIRLVLVVAAAFFCCWTPYNVASFFKALELLGVYKDTPWPRVCHISQAIRHSLQITEAIAYSHGCLNPLLYFCIGDGFRKNILKLINSGPCKLCRVWANSTPQDRDEEPSSPQTQQSHCVDDKCGEAIALNCVN